MQNVKLLKHLPWLVLAAIWIAGAALWLLFVVEQQTHTRLAFDNQLERVADELFRGRLEGRLTEESLPEGIVCFAIYDAQGTKLAEWGQGAPAQVDPTSLSWQSGDRLVRAANSGTVSLTKALQPLRPRMGLMVDGDDRPPEDQQRKMGPTMNPRRSLGFLHIGVPSAPLDGRLMAWTLGGAAGTAAWSGFVVFVGLLWFRTRRFQDALTQHRELLQFAEASRTLGHELQNPLAAILLQTALLKRQHGAEVPGEVTIIEEEARRMSGLVARVRDFLKDPKGQAEWVDLAALVSSLQGRFASELTLTTDGAAPYGVRFDAYRLRSVVENLLKNAFESGPDPRPEARLTRPKAGWVRLEVLDRGAGFSNDALKQARDPFFTTKTTGTGIGLSIADSFVTAAGGKLKLENRPEGGARVAIDLPEATQETPA